MKPIKLLGFFSDWQAWHLSGPVCPLATRDHLTVLRNFSFLFFFISFFLQEFVVLCARCYFRPFLLIMLCKYAGTLDQFYCKMLCQVLTFV